MLRREPRYRTAVTGTVNAMVFTTPLHGSCHPRHVFVAEGVTTAIDLDRSFPADPARDVAGIAD